MPILQYLPFVSFDEIPRDVGYEGYSYLDGTLFNYSPEDVKNARLVIEVNGKVCEDKPIDLGKEEISIQKEYKVNEGDTELAYVTYEDVSHGYTYKIYLKTIIEGEQWVGDFSYVYDKDGIVTEEKINYLLEMRASGRDKVQDYADKFGAKFFAGEKPWGVKVDVVMPCATQNDVNMDEAKKIVANGVKYYIEVANMPTTNDALRFLLDQPNVIVAPSKAVNAGGVLVSGLEMSQNSERYSWTAEEVDAKLHQIMIGIHDSSAAAAEEFGLGYNLVAGGNIAGFKKVAEAMMSQGVV